MENKYSPITFVTIAMGGGGTERVIATLADYLAKYGEDVCIAMIGGDECAYDLDSRIAVEALVGKTGGSLCGKIQRITRLRRLIRKRKGNVIAMGSVCGLYSSIATVAISSMRLFISERNVPDRINKRPYSASLLAVRNILYGRAYRIILQTDDMKKAFTDRIRKKSIVIGNPIDSSLREPYKGARQNRIVSAGRLTADKNYRLLIEAFCEFYKKKNEYSLDIYGSGELEEELKLMIEVGGLGECVHIHPFSTKLHDDIADAKIYVSSSDSEGLSNSVMEALALGIPVVATDCPIGGNRMLVDDGCNGYLVPVGNREAMTEAMLKIAEDLVGYEKMSGNAMAIRDKYSVYNISNEWMRLFV